MTQKGSSKRGSEGRPIPAPRSLLEAKIGALLLQDTPEAKLELARLEQELSLDMGLYIQGELRKKNEALEIENNRLRASINDDLRCMVEVAKKAEGFQQERDALKLENERLRAELDAARAARSEEPIAADAAARENHIRGIM